MDLEATDWQTKNEFEIGKVNFTKALQNRSVEVIAGYACKEIWTGYTSNTANTLDM